MSMQGSGTGRKVRLVDRDLRGDRQHGRDGDPRLAGVHDGHTQELPGDLRALGPWAACSPCVEPWCVAELAAALPRRRRVRLPPRGLRPDAGVSPAGRRSSRFLLAAGGRLRYIAALYLLTPFGLAQDQPGRLRVVAAAIIIAITIPNLLGHRQSAWTQNLTTMLKLGLFAALAVLASLLAQGPVVPHQRGTAPQGSRTGDRDDAVVLRYVRVQRVECRRLPGGRSEEPRSDLALLAVATPAS